MAIKGSLDGFFSDCGRGADIGGNKMCDNFGYYCVGGNNMDGMGK